MKLPSFLKSAALALAFSATASMQAASLLLPDSSTTPDPEEYDAIFAALTPVASSTNSLYLDLDNETQGTVTGTLTTRVYDGISMHGGLTFVYELTNTGAVGYEGISFLELGGWAGFDITVAYGLLPSQPFGGVNPGETIRYPDEPSSEYTAGKIVFTFPPGSEEPPIFANEHGMQLILFTSATSFTSATGTVLTDTFLDIYTIDGNVPQQSLLVKTFTASTGSAPGVPDGGTTALLLGAALVSLAVVSRSKSRRSAR